ncbi:MAG: glycosyltransferase family 9 protein [Rhodocyclaceae bacterium]
MSEFRPRTILVYSNGDTFGDALIKIPALQALRATWPDSHITWLAGRGHSLYTDTFAYSVTHCIDEILDDAGIGEHWTELLRRPLPDRRFDLIIDTQQFIKTTLIVRRIRHVHFVSGAFSFRLSDRRPAGGGRPRGMLERILQLISLAAGHTVAPIYGIRVPAEHIAEAARLLPDGARYVGFAPGAGQPWKCWPLNRFVDVATACVAQGLVPVFFLGPQERAWQHSLVQALPNARFPELVTPGPYLTMALGQRLAASVCNDSGTGHMLASAARPLVTLYGRTDPDKFRPNTPHHFPVCARDHGGSGMDAIPVAAVTAALECALQITI